MNDTHKTAREGFSIEAQAYARGRPEYPRDLLPWLKRDLGIGTGKTVVDLGAGTGKFTQLLKQTGVDIIAVEPVKEMYLQLEKTLPRVRVLPGRADAVPLESGSVDALVCAQAFHWFANEAALREIHRILKPRGKLGLIWNVRDESVDWVSAITNIITPYEGDAPRSYKRDWENAFDGKYFTAPEKTSFAYQHVGTPQRVIVDRFLSVSFIAALPNDEKLKVAEQLRALIASHPALRQKREIAFPYRTEAYSCTRLEEVHGR